MLVFAIDPHMPSAKEKKNWPHVGCLEAFFYKKELILIARVDIKQGFLSVG